MKILLATSSVTPNAGIPSFNREFCSLINKDNKVHLLVDEDIKRYPGYEKVYSTYGINIYSYKDCFRILNILLSEKYDIIINSNSHIMSLLSAFLEDKTRIITIAHSLGTMDCDNAAFNNKYIDNIIALSLSGKDYIRRRFKIKNENKIKVVFNSVADNIAAESIRKTKINTSKIRIVFAGGSAASKSPDIVVQVLNKLCETDLSFEFYWLGITTPPLKKFQPFNDIRTILPEDKRIIVTGLIPQEKAAEIIASCNIFLAPSRREGFPMALLEAMRIGCIPIVSDFKIANQEIIKDGLNGYVIPHKNIQLFVDKISDIICNHAAYKEIYEESYNTFVRDLSFSNWRNKIHLIMSSKSLSHSKRMKINKLMFRIVVLRFRILDVYNLIENHIKEVLPCAIKFYNFFKKNSYANSKR